MSAELRKESLLDLFKSNNKLHTTEYEFWNFVMENQFITQIERFQKMVKIFTISCHVEHLQKLQNLDFFVLNLHFSQIASVSIKTFFGTGVLIKEHVIIQLFWYLYFYSYSFLRYWILYILFCYFCTFLCNVLYMCICKKQLVLNKLRFCPKWQRTQKVRRMRCFCSKFSRIHSDILTLLL